jgi:hypothetical protein
MSLHEYLSTSSDYETHFRDLGLQVRKKKGLLLVKHPYDMDLATKPEWVRQCRGAVIDTETKRLVCLPPVKAYEMPLDALGSDETEVSTETEYQTLIDGTMINVFHHKGKWIHSTRGDIGAKNRWDDKMSFYDMFKDCGDIEYEELDPSCSYSFLMRHQANRVVSPVHYNELYLVEMYRFTEEGPQRLLVSEYPSMSFHNIRSFPLEEHDGSLQLPYTCKGLTVKRGHLRYKYLNPSYVEVQKLKPNTNSPYLNYLELRQNGSLKEYLEYFPEHVHPFNEYRDNIHKITNELYTTYKAVHIHKTQDKKDVPYHLKPLVYEVHGNYLDSKKPTTWQDIKQFIHELPPKKLMFALNYC